MQVSVPYMAEIIVATHFFVIVPKHIKARDSVYIFATPLLEYKWGYDPHSRKNVRMAAKVWGGTVADHSSFRYPISLLPRMLKILEQNGIERGRLNTIYLPRYEPAPAAIDLQDRFTLYDYQLEALEFTEQERNKSTPSALINIATGLGKSLILMAYAAKIKLRMAIVASATYSEKWKADILSNTKATEEQINLVSGRAGIKKIFALSEGAGYDKDFTIFSIETLHRFFKEYEENQELCADIYGGTPVQLWEAMKCGFLGGDEMHENLNAIYWMNTFIHGPFHLGLSATMLHKDSFIEDRQHEIYPACKRFDKIKMKKYINLVYFGYMFKDFDRSRIKSSFPGKSTYAQDAYEQSIITSKASRENFVDMVVYSVQQYYVSKRKPGDKLRIYFSRINMINMITDALKNEFPELDVRRYAENDDYSIIIDSDIGVTNRGKAGTGVDIPGLTTVINFTNVESSQAVLQLLGRLREIKDKEVIFVQAFCKNVKKHLQYKDNCHDMINERIKGFIHHDYQIAL